MSFTAVSPVQLICDHKKEHILYSPCVAPDLITAIFEAKSAFSSTMKCEKMAASFGTVVTKIVNPVNGEDEGCTV